MSLEGTYQLSYSEHIADRLQELSDRAVISGLLQRYLELLAEMHRRLTETPEQWGDPIYRYEHLGLDVY